MPELHQGTLQSEKFSLILAEHIFKRADPTSATQNTNDAGLCQYHVESSVHGLLAQCGSNKRRALSSFLGSA
jgi:hypothetical protein